MDFTHDNNDENNHKYRKQKTILITLIVFIVAIPLEMMVAIYYDINEGSYFNKWSLAYNFLWLIILIIIIAIVTPKSLKDTKAKEFATALLILFLSGAIVVSKMFFLKNQMKSIEENALNNSYSTIGFVTDKIIKTHTGRSGYTTYTYYLWAGQSDPLSKRHTVPEHLYNRINVGDTVILQISKEYPRINKVLIWDPREDEIAKYLIENN